MIGTFIMMSMNSESGFTNERRYCPWSMNRIASVRPAWIKHVVQVLVVRLQVPRQVRAQKDEAQVVHLAVVLPMFEQSRVMLGLACHQSLPVRC